MKVNSNYFRGCSVFELMRNAHANCFINHHEILGPKQTLFPSFPSSAPPKTIKEVSNLETSSLQLFSKKRDQLDIVNAILKVAKKGASKTRIMYNANLSFKGVTQYLSFMVENELLLKTREDYKPVYYASEKGLAFLSSYTQLVQLLQ